MFVDVKYAKAADGTYVAYAVFGSGPIDLVYSFGYLSNIDSSAEDAESSAVWQGLSSFARLIVFDRRGAGLSDRTSAQEISTLEAGMDDIRAVMDAAGSRRALLVGAQDGGMLCALFAASYPERTLGLVCFGGSPRGQWAPDFPWGQTEAQHERWIDVIERSWGSVDQARWFMSQIAPEKSLNADELAAAARLFRSLASPGGAMAVERMLYHSDVRAALAAVRVPALVLHTVGNQIEPVEVGRYVASVIPGARFVELPGTESLPVYDSRVRFIDEVRRFAVEVVDEEAELDRVLATVLFTDIVDSTAIAAAVGDRAWTKLVAEHHAVVRAALARYRGHEVDTAGDGFFAAAKQLRPPGAQASSEFRRSWRSTHHDAPAPPCCGVDHARGGPFGSGRPGAARAQPPVDHLGRVCRVDRRSARGGDAGARRGVDAGARCQRDVNRLARNLGDRREVAGYPRRALTCANSRRRRSGRCSDLRSHRRGHWFEPSIAHRVAAGHRACSQVHAAGVHQFPGRAHILRRCRA